MQIADLDTRLKRAGDHASVRWLKEHRRWLLIVGVVAIAALGFEALRAVLTEVRLKDVRAALHQIAPARLAAALLLTVASYLCLTLYDWLALRTIGSGLPWKTAALASFTSYTISHNLGLSFLTGGSARYRVYSSAGLDLADVARITLIASGAFWGGILAIAGVAFLTTAQSILIGPATFTPMTQHIAGGLILATVAALFVARTRGADRIGVGGLTVPIPSTATMAAQILVAALDLLAASAALFVLVPDMGVDAFGAFFLAYAVAIVIALVTHVPGGIGVFEAVILAIVPGLRSDVFAALLVYRVVYYLLPLAVAAGLLAGLEGRRIRHRITAGLSVFERVSRALAPPLLAVLVAIGGFVLLLSGALPAVHSRIAWVAHFVPLPFVEASHFSSSLAGTALLLVAPAINARLRTGFHAARLLLIGGAAFSLLKGFDYEEALVLGLIAATLQYCRPAFYRRGGVFDAPLQRTWLAGAALVIALSLWSGTFAYKHVEYSEDLWWAFTYAGNAPRFLRASLGALVLFVAIAAWRLLWAPVRPLGVTALPADVALAAFAVSPRSDAALAFTGDKQFLISQARDAFLMYQVQGRTWVVMGDPVGANVAWPELVWEIRALCDAARGRLCFYQASEEMLPLLVELGLQVMKYGEEAEVDLGSFSLEGPAMRKLRNSVRKCEAQGVRFEVLPAADACARGPELQAVSDAWLQQKPGGEKRFSVGRFDPDYLARFDIAVLTQDGRIIAFANVWATNDGSELSVDMMRKLPDSPNGAMDILIVRLMQWGAERAYAKFNLGMAPLSGLRGGRLSPLWSRIGHAIYGHAEQFYGFSGIRSFKMKFAPSWSSRYVATPSGLASARSMVDLVALVGGE